MLVSTVIVAGIFLGVFPQLAGYRDVWSTLQSPTPAQLMMLTIVAAFNLVVYWFVLVAVLPGLRLREAAVVNQATTAVANSFPGGGAVGVGLSFAMYGSWGFSTASIALATLVSGIWNNLVKLGMPIVALALLALEGTITASRVLGAALGVASLVATVATIALALRSPRLAHALGTALARLVSTARRFVGRAPVTGWGERATDFRREVITLLRDRWLTLTAATLASHLSLFALLLVTLRFGGVAENQIGWIQVFAAFSFVRLISALPVTPGGVGVVELGLVAALTIGVPKQLEAQVIAAVLLFRAITFLLPIPLGVAGYVFWRRNRSWRREPRT